VERAAIPGATVQFTLGTQGCSATTDAAGVATCNVVLKQSAGNYAVTASFGGVFGVDAGTSVSRPFGVTLEETTLSYTGDTVIASGGTAHMSGVLLEDNVTPIAGRTVKFTLGTGGTAHSCSATTDAAGKAGCTISPVAQPLGTGTVPDSFAGDAVYRAASANASTTLFAFLSSGGFVVGDQSGHTGSKATFWGAQWSSNNSLTGGTAQSTFKGFADSLSAEPPVCALA